MIDLAELFEDCIITEVEDKSPEWLENRKKGIGGSDASVVMGINQYKRKRDLWLEKTGRVCDPFKGNEATRKGDRLESPMIQMFAARHPEYTMIDTKHISLANRDYPFMAVSLDGAYLDETNDPTVLEIKSTTIQNMAVLDQWKDQIPQTYYCQILHQMMVTGFKKATLFAVLDMPFWNKQELREFTFYANECQEDMELLKEAEIEFWQSVEKDEEPNLI